MEHIGIGAEAPEEKEEMTVTVTVSVPDGTRVNMRTKPDRKASLIDAKPGSSSDKAVPQRENIVLKGHEQFYYFFAIVYFFHIKHPLHVISILVHGLSLQI